MKSSWYLRSESGPLFGPAHIEVLREWAEQGRIGPDSLVSADRTSWAPAYSLPELEMDWMVDAGSGAGIIGPINLKALRDLLLDGSVGSASSLINRHSRETVPLHRKMDDIFARPTPPAPIPAEQPPPPSPSPVAPDILGRIADLETRLRAATEQRTRTEADLQSALRGREDDRQRLEAQLLARETALQQAREAQSAAKTGQREANDHATETQKRLNESEARAEQSRHELAEVRQQLAVSKQGLAGLQQELAVSQQELAEAQQGLAGLQQELAEAQQRIRLSEESTREQEQRHQADAEQWRVAQSELRKTLQATQMKLAAEAEARTRAASTAANRERELLVDIERLNQEVGTLGSRTVQLNQSLETAREQLAAAAREAVQRNASHSVDIERLTAEQQSLRVAATQAAETVAASRRQQEADRLRAAQREGDLSRQLTAVTQRAEALQAKVQQLQSDVSVRSAEVVDMKRRHDDDIVAVSTRMTAQQSRIRELEATVAIDERELADVRNRLSMSQSQSATLESESRQRIATLEQQVAERSQYATRCDQALHDLESELQQVTEERDRRKAQMEAREEVDRLGGDLDQFRQTLMEHLRQLAGERVSMKTVADELRQCLSLQHASLVNPAAAPPTPPAPPFPSGTLNRLEELLAEKDRRIEELERHALAGQRVAPSAGIASPETPTPPAVETVHELEILPPPPPEPPLTPDDERTKKAFRPLDTTMWTGVFTRRSAPRNQEKKAADLADIEAQARRELMAWRKGKGSPERPTETPP